MGCTKLVETFLFVIVFIQILAKADIKKHGVLAEKVLLTEFVQLNDMGIMMPLDPAKSTLK